MQRLSQIIFAYNIHEKVYKRQRNALETEAKIFATEY